MLYLIRTFGRGKKSSLKVGYSNDPRNRLDHYRIHNPLFEVIAQREGTQDDELLLQFYLTARGYKAGFLNEWFLDSPAVQDIFHRSLLGKRVKRSVWKHRRELFTKFDIKNTRRKRLYEELRNLYGPGRSELDIDWKQEEMKKCIKEINRQRDSGLLDYLM